MSTLNKIMKRVVFEVKSVQYSLKEVGQEIHIDFQKEKKTGDEISFPRVLSFNDNFGKPYLDKIKIIGEVIGQKLRKKISILNYKPKKRTVKRQGIRQKYTKVRIVSVEGELI